RPTHAAQQAGIQQNYLVETVSFICSNSVSTSTGGFVVSSDTTMATTKFAMTPGTISWRLMASLMAGTVPQTYDTAAPATIPVRAPMAVTRRQYNARRIIGPKAAPKPAHAKPTRSNTVESGFCAISSAMMLTTTTDPRPNQS